jgi:hypothetical protein
MIAGEPRMTSAAQLQPKSELTTDFPEQQSRNQRNSRKERKKTQEEALPHRSLRLFALFVAIY